LASYAGLDNPLSASRWWRFTHLFVSTTSYRPVEKFREEAGASLPKADANKLIKLCQSASAPRVSFETTEREAA
jgi:hypothetical protein